MRKFRTVIIGMGRMGKTRYVAMKKHGHFEITGLCDNDISQLGEYDINKYEDWKCSIDQERPEIVVVCTVNAVIPQVVCYALEKGCHVFAEKPPGKTLEDALTMKKAFLKHKNQILKFGFNHRYHYSVIEAKSLIDSGFLGKVVNIRGVYGLSLIHI